jgi:hypothetical protein
MWSLELFVLFVMVYLIFNGPLLVVAPAIDSLFGKSWFDNVEFAKVPAAFAVLTAAILVIMMGEVVISQLLSSSGKKFGLFLYSLVVAFHVIGRVRMKLRLGIGGLSKGSFASFSLSRKGSPLIGHAIRLGPSSVEKH